MGSRGYELSRRFVENGHEVLVVSGIYEIGEPSRSSKKLISHEIVDGIRIIWVNVSSSTFQRFWTRVTNFLIFTLISSWIVLKQDYDFVYVTSPPLMSGITGLLSKFLKRKPFVFEVRDPWPQVAIDMGILKSKFLIWLAQNLEKIMFVFL